MNNSHKFDHLDDMEKIFERYILPKLTQVEIGISRDSSIRPTQRSQHQACPSVDQGTRLFQLEILALFFLLFVFSIDGSPRHGYKTQHRVHQQIHVSVPKIHGPEQEESIVNHDTGLAHKQQHLMGILTCSTVLAP